MPVRLSVAFLAEAGHPPRKKFPMRWVSGFQGVRLPIVLAFGLHRAWRARGHFQHLSRHDGLTGLANHSWFFEHAQTRMGEARQDIRRQFLVLADIDHFKTINDTNGHQVGDRVLCNLADSLETVFGPDALIGRLGGEEFGILTEARSATNVFEAIERLQARLKDEQTGDDTPQIPLSLGLSQISYDDTTADAFRSADELLYKAKRAGRNQLVADPGLEGNPDETADY